MIREIRRVVLDVHVLRRLQVEHHSCERHLGEAMVVAVRLAVGRRRDETMAASPRPGLARIGNGEHLARGERRVPPSLVGSGSQCAAPTSAPSRGVRRRSPRASMRFAHTFASFSSPPNAMPCEMSPS
jgi:hypothetical protein